MGSFLDKIAKRLAVAKGSETLDGKTMTGEQPNKVVINPEIQIRSEDSNNFSFSEFHQSQIYCFFAIFSNFQRFY
jgi:hypothetical protein